MSSPGCYTPAKKYIPRLKNICDPFFDSRSAYDLHKASSQSLSQDRCRDNSCIRSTMNLAKLSRPKPGKVLSGIFGSLGGFHRMTDDFPAVDASNGRRAKWVPVNMSELCGSSVEHPWELDSHGDLVLSGMWMTFLVSPTLTANALAAAQASTVQGMCARVASASAHMIDIPSG